MFLISHNLNHKKLDYAFYLLNGGLLVAGLNWFLTDFIYLEYFAWFLVASGLATYLSYVWESYTKRLRKELDIGMKYTVLALVIILIPVVASLLVLLIPQSEYELLSRLITFYGFTIIVGLITTIILGQTYKTLPFIIWLHKYKPLIGKYKTPLPKALYSENVAKIQMGAYIVSILSLTFAILLANPLLLKLGSVTFLLTAILYNLNVLKIVFHKTKTESIV